MSGKFTPSPPKSERDKYCTISTMKEWVWYRGCDHPSSFWLHHREFVIRVEENLISTDLQENWEQNYKLERLPEGDLVITLHVNS